MAPADSAAPLSPEHAGPRPPPRRGARLLPWIAAERVVRGVLLVAAGIVLVTHQHADYGRVARRWADYLGLNPGGHLVSRLIQRAHALTAHQVLVFGLIALAYGVLECVEGAGLWRRRRWAEYLTVVATSVLVPVEIWELSRHPSALKAGGLVVNLVIVAYLVHALRRREA